MSEQIDISQSGQVVAIKTNIAAGGAVRPIVPQDFDSTYRFAQAVIRSGMAPKGIDSTDKAMVCILHGLEVGMTPMAALQSIAPINGRPAIWGDGALGLVQGSGLLEWHKEFSEGKEDTDDFTAVCEVKRRNDKEIKRGEFSIKDAKTANLWGKSGPWTGYPKRMLKMRARAFALRDGFADVLRGLHIAEEAQDVREMRDITPPPPPEDAPSAGQEETTSPSNGEVETEPEITDDSDDPDTILDWPEWMDETDTLLRATNDEPTFNEVWTDRVEPVLDECPADVKAACEKLRGELMPEAEEPTRPTTDDYAALRDFQKALDRAKTEDECDAIRKSHQPKLENAPESVWNQAQGAYNAALKRVRKK